MKSAFTRQGKFSARVVSEEKEGLLKRGFWFRALSTEAFARFSTIKLGMMFTLWLLLYPSTRKTNRTLLLYWRHLWRLGPLQSRGTGRLALFVSEKLEENLPRRQAGLF